MPLGRSRARLEEELDSALAHLPESGIVNRRVSAGWVDVELGRLPEAQMPITVVVGKRSRRQRLSITLGAALPLVAVTRSDTKRRLSQCGNAPSHFPGAIWSKIDIKQRGKKIHHGLSRALPRRTGGRGGHWEPE